MFDIAIVLILFSVFSCKNNLREEEKTIEEVKIIEEVNFMPKNDTTFFAYFNNNEVQIDIKYPKQKPKGTILILHGWDCKHTEIVENTSFCDSALQHNFTLIMPNLGKCNYMSKIYPETHKNLQSSPTLTWIIDTMIPLLQTNFNLLDSTQKNYIMGLSTGGRGATMLAYKIPHLFTAIATVSGEFDITKRPDYYLYYAYLGNYENHKERWKDECFAFDCENYFVPTYIAHGLNDNVAMPKNSISMYDSLKLYHQNLRIEKHFVENQGHNYNYWNTETSNILIFFEK